MKFYKLISMILTVMILSSMFAACNKNQEEKSKSANNDTVTVQKPSTNSTIKTTAPVDIKTTDKSNVSASSDIKNSDAGTSSENEIINLDSGNDTSVSIDYLIDTGVLTEDVKEEKIDLKGITITKSIWDPTQKYLDNSSMPQYTYMSRKISELEKKYNFKYEEKVIALGYTPYYNEIIKQSMAGIRVADIFKSRTEWSFPSFVNKNIIIPLDDYINYEAPVIKNSALYKGTMWNGKHYGIYWNCYGATPRVMYNKDILNREGQPDILDLVESGQWTWETFLGIVSNCTRDTNGDGIVDQWGIVTDGKWGFIEQILYSNGVSAVNIVDGNAIMGVDNLQGLKALQFASDLAFVHKVFTTDSSLNLYKKGNAAICLAGVWGNIAFLKSGVNSMAAPLPLGPDVTTYQNIDIYNSDAISSLCEQPDDVAKIWMEVNLIWDENLQKSPEYYELYKKLYPDDWDWNPANESRMITTEREFELSIKSLWPLFKIDYTIGYGNLRTEMAYKIGGPILSGQGIYQVVEREKAWLQNYIDQFK